jgi:hypothetical protein
MAWRLDNPEPRFDEVEPRGRGRGEMRAHPRVGGQPLADLDALVGGVVVHHQVQLAAGVGPGDLLEEAQEFLVAVPGAGTGR